MISVRSGVSYKNEHDDTLSLSLKSIVSVSGFRQIVLYVEDEVMYGIVYDVVLTFLGRL